MSEATRGPWKVADDTERVGRFGWYVRGPKGVDICRLMASPREANAHLIAASPDLLEALKAALKAMDYMGDIMNGMDIVMEEDEAVVNPAFMKARAAIKKAEGTDQ